MLLIALLNSRKKIKKANSQFQLLNDETIRQKEIIETKNEELNKKNAELTDTNTVKDKLIYIIAHDLKNPLHAILGYADILLADENKKLDSDTLRLLGIIHNSTTSANLLLDNLLQWSRFQTRSLPFRPVILSVDSLLKEEISLLEPMANEKQIVLKMKYDKGLSVLADPNMLRAIFRNLVINSIKFTKPGGNIEVSAQGRESAVEFSVSDNGTGIDPKIGADLLANSNNFSTQGTLGEKGTGLGLKIVKDFVEAHSGTLWFESEPEKGTRFFFTIPAGGN